VVSLATLIAAVVSNESLFVNAEKAEFVEAARRLVPDDPIAPRPVPTISVQGDTAYGNFVPGGFTPPPIAQGDTQALAIPAAPTAERTAALPPASAAPPRPGTERDTVSPVRPAAPPARKDAEEIAFAARDSECPHGWIAMEGEGPPRQCDKAAALLDIVAVPDELRPVEQAALERAAEIAGLEFAPGIPHARPEPPAITQNPTQKTTLAKWPADPPPKCGSRERAKWHYVNQVPTWYCRARKERSHQPISQDGLL
jgi:hypothetical protein